MAKVRVPQVGGWQCGGVRYALTVRPVMVAACHCTACQGHSASAFGLSVFVPRGGFTVNREALGYVTRTADSGRDIDALKTVGNGINAIMRKPDKGVLLITHYQRLLDYVKPDFVHILSQGRIVKTGDAELSQRLEAEGYDAVMAEAA